MSPVESPQAPSTMAASMRPRMVASSLALGGRRAKPMAASLSVP